jgi:hypothetical protein
MNFFDHKDLGNQLLQLCSKVVKHSVYNYHIRKNYCSAISIFYFIVAAAFCGIKWRWQPIGEKDELEALGSIAAS